MKKALYTTAALLVLAGSSAPAVTLSATRISDKPTTKQTEPGSGTNQIPPTCPLHDPNGCGILD